MKADGKEIQILIVVAREIPLEIETNMNYENISLSDCVSWPMERKNKSQLSVLGKSSLRFHFHLGLQMESKDKS